MINKILLQLCVALFSICFLACEKQREEYPDIQIGKDKTISELFLNKQMEKKVLLSGGNGKYMVNVENSQIATARISGDTLKVKGLLEGTTFATVISHDKSVRLSIHVIFPELSVSHPEILLRPGIKRKFISISGGGELTLLIEDDPADVIDVKWDASTGMLEINPHYEGEAKITAVSENGKDKQVISIKVRPEGELTIPGWYTTKASSYYPVLNNKMVVKRKGVGIWIANSARPYGGWISARYTGFSLKLGRIVAPVQGDSIDLNVISYDSSKPEIKTGIHRLYVEEVRESEVMLRGKGSKFLLPYEK